MVLLILRCEQTIKLVYFCILNALFSKFNLFGPIRTFTNDYFVFNFTEFWICYCCLLFARLEFHATFTRQGTKSWHFYPTITSSVSLNHAKKLLKTEVLFSFCRWFTRAACTGRTGEEDWYTYHDDVRTLQSTGIIVVPSMYNYQFQYWHLYREIILNLCHFHQSGGWIINSFCGNLPRYHHRMISIHCLMNCCGFSE